MARRADVHGARWTRRQLLRAVAGVGSLGALAPMLGPSPAWARAGGARRLIVFYFPDGVPGRSDAGDPSLWHPGLEGGRVVLPEASAPLARWREQSVFFRGVTMGPADSGSHPGGARKLLTGVDGGQGESLDQLLARTVGAGSPHRHLYLGVQATTGGAQGDRFISHVAPGVTAQPEDDPRRAWQRLFGAGTGPGEPSGEGSAQGSERSRLLDGIGEELAAMRRLLGPSERTRLDVHVESLRELERRLDGGDRGGDPVGVGCDGSWVPSGAPEGRAHEPERFPALLEEQMRLMVQAMACGLTRVGVLQASHHTSELIMSRFPETSLHDPGFDMRSHQASHYGPRHDRGRRQFRDYLSQRVWWMEQYSALLSLLASEPEGEGTMLDYSVVLLCSEVADGNTHLHDDIPLVVSGGGGGRVRTGRLLESWGTRHASVLASLGVAMGGPTERFGDTGSVPWGELLSGV